MIYYRGCLCEIKVFRTEGSFGMTWGIGFGATGTEYPRGEE